MDLPWEALQWPGRDGATHFSPVATGKVELLRYVHRERLSGGILRPRTLRVAVLLGDLTAGEDVAEDRDQVRRELEALASALGGIAAHVELFAGSEESARAAGELTVHVCKNRGALLEHLAQGFHVLHWFGHSISGPRVARPERETSAGAGGIGLRMGGEVGDLLVSALAACLHPTCARLLVLHACDVRNAMGLELTEAVDHVVGTGAVVDPALFGGRWEKFYGMLFGGQGTVARAVRELRLDSEQPNRLECAWIPRHWSRTCERMAFRKPEEESIAEFLDRQAVNLDRIDGEFARDHGGGKLRPLVVEVRAESRGAASSGGSYPLSDLVLPSEVQPIPPARILLLGDPGAGKSTMLKDLALKLTDRAHRFGTLVPVHVRLVESTARNFKALLEEAADGSKPKKFRRAIQNRCAISGGVLLLLDGLDEVQDIDRVRKLIQSVPASVRVLVSGRRSLQLGSDFPRDMTLGLLPLGPERQVELLEKLFAHINRLRKEDAEGLPGAPAVQLVDAAVEIRLLLENLSKGRFGEDIKPNPLYLNRAGHCHANGERVSTERHKFFAQVLGGMLAGDHSAKRAEGAKPVPDRHFLQVAALELVLAGERLMGVDQVEDWLDPLADEHRRDLLDDSDSAYSDAQRFRTLLGRIARTSGLLIPLRSRPEWDFEHNTFREALAAERLFELYQQGSLETVQQQVSQGLAGADAGSVAGERVNAWAEVVMLFAWWLSDPENAPPTRAEGAAAAGAGHEDEPSTDLERWVVWLSKQHPRLAVRVVEAGPRLPIRLTLKVLGMEEGLDAGGRRDVYMRIAETEQLDLAIQKLGGIGEVILERREAGKDWGAGRWEEIEDLGLLDGLLLDLAQREPSGEAGAPAGQDLERLRTKALETAGRLLEKLVPGEERLEAVRAAFESVPGTQVDYWAAVQPPEEGRFRAGSDAAERQATREADENLSDARWAREEHRSVSLEQRYWLARAPVTWEQFALLDPEFVTNHRGEDEADAPARWISSHRARFFARWAHACGVAPGHEQDADSGGFVVQLPTEAQWEFGARDAGGDWRPFLGAGFAEFEDIYGPARQSPGAVSFYGAHGGLQLFAMHRSVLQWTRDAWVAQIDENGDRGNPGTFRAARVLRGGACGNSPRHCRSAFRVFDDPRGGFFFGDVFGFRLAFAAAPASLGPGASSLDH